MLDGKKPEVNDTKTYDNGVKVVPAYLLQPVSVDKDNYQKVLVDAGYYTADRAQVDPDARCGAAPAPPPCRQPRAPAVHDGTV